MIDYVRVSRQLRRLTAAISGRLNEGPSGVDQVQRPPRIRGSGQTPPTSQGGSGQTAVWPEKILVAEGDPPPQTSTFADVWSDVSQTHLMRQDSTVELMARMLNGFSVV